MAIAFRLTQACRGGAPEWFAHAQNMGVETGTKAVCPWTPFARTEYRAQTGDYAVALGLWKEAGCPSHALWASDTTMRLAPEWVDAWSGFGVSFGVEPEFFSVGGAVRCRAWARLRAESSDGETVVWHSTAGVVVEIPADEPYGSPISPERREKLLAMPREAWREMGKWESFPLLIATE